MPSPPIQLFLTTIASAPALRQKQEYLLRILQVKKIAFVSYDLASDENAKRLWRRRAPKEHQALPGMLIGGRWAGSFEQFEEAVERGELETFLRLKDDYDPDLDGKVLAAQPIGVPGAAMPLQMQGHKPSFAPTGATPMKKSGEAGTGDEIIDAGDALPGYGFQGLKITMNELTDLAKELGLNDKETPGLKHSSPKGKSKVPPVQSQESVAAPTEKIERAEDKAFAAAEFSEEKAIPVPSEKSATVAEADKEVASVDKIAAEPQPSVQLLKLGETAASEEEAKPS